MSVPLPAGLQLVAHGGTGGALLEAALAVGILFLFLTVWLRERRATRRRDELDDRALTDDDLFRDEEDGRAP